VGQPVTNSDRVLQYLARIAPKAASNADISSATGIKPHAQVFQITNHLMTTGKLEGRQFGKEWQFWWTGRPTQQNAHASDNSQAAAPGLALGSIGMKRGRGPKAQFEEKIASVLASLDSAHSAYLDSEVFGGPSLYFHVESLRAAENRDFDRFAEQVYALLSSWGMHRMGPGGSKMLDFQPFKDSLRRVRPIADELMDKWPETLDSNDWRELESVFRGITCMRSGTSLVGNSKVMAHWLPRLVPPVDRSYTLKLLYGYGAVENGLDNEWTMLEGMLRGFFYPLLRSPVFSAKATEWLAVTARHSAWDSSALKIADNVVIGFVKLQNAAQHQHVG
jgi:hypothetical protein